MALEAIIERFETGTPEDADFEHPLAREIVEELAQCRENEQQRALFADARKVADHLIEQYLGLDREDKLRMAEVYKNEECFRKIGGLYGKIRIRIQKQLEAKKLDLLLQISNYSKLVPILEAYTHYVEESDDLTQKTARLRQYLSSYNLNGKKVGHASSDKLEGMLFRQKSSGKVRQRRKSSAKKAHQSFLASITLGIPEELKHRVIGATNLLPQRERILNNYITYVTENSDLTPGRASLTTYLGYYTIKGERLPKYERNGLRAFSTYDFKRQERRKGDNTLLLESMMDGVQEELRQRVLDAASLLVQRIQILQNYVKYVGDTDNRIPRTRSLIYYLLRHDKNGKKVKRSSKASCTIFYTWDFENGEQLETKNAITVFNSMTYGVPEELKERVLDADSLLPQRIKILQNYTNYVETGDNLNTRNWGLAYYLFHHNIQGRRVKERSKYSLSSFYNYDFRDSRSAKERTPKSVVTSMTYRVKDPDLVAKVRGYALSA